MNFLFLVTFKEHLLLWTGPNCKCQDTQEVGGHILETSNVVIEDWRREEIVLSRYVKTEWLVDFDHDLKQESN